MSTIQNIKRKDGVIVGFVKDNIFRKRVKGSKHLFRKLDAWGCDAVVLEQLPENCVIRILDEENQTVYQVTKKKWLENQKFFHFKTENVDHSTQSFLPRQFFDRAKPN